MSSEPSQIHGVKDQAVGAIKENVGWAVNNAELETTGLAQKQDGICEVEQAKIEPEATTPFEPSIIHGAKDQAVGVVKENVGYVIRNPELEATGRAQKEQGIHEIDLARIEQAAAPSEPSIIHGAKDQAVGVVKEKVGLVIRNPELETTGRMQKEQGIHEITQARMWAEAKVPENSNNTAVPDMPDTLSDEQTLTLPSDPSTIHAVKEQTVGVVKENVGWAIRNAELEAEGRAQKELGLRELELVRAAQPHTELLPGLTEPSTIHAVKEQTVGVVKENVGWAIRNEELEAAGRAQKEQGLRELEELRASQPHTDTELLPISTEPSTIHAVKEQTVGVVKENVGWAIRNAELEAEGRTQKEQGIRELEELRAAQPQTELLPTSTEPSTIHAVKEQTVGVVKENVGWAIRNEELEAAGRAQKEQGLKEFEEARSELPPLYPDPSTIRGVKDQAVGVIKEKVGRVIGKEELEIAGRDQKEQGVRECTMAKGGQEGKSLDDESKDKLKDMAGQIQGNRLQDSATTDTRQSNI